MSRAELDTLGVIGQLFAASLDEAALKRVATRLSIPLPWVGLLPKALHAEFVAEFQDTARACIAVARFDRLTTLLEAWQATAEAYADPSVTADGSDLEYLDVAEVVARPERPRKEEGEAVLHSEADGTDTAAVPGRVLLERCEPGHPKETD